MLFRVKFGKEVSEVDMLSTVVLEELISCLLERSYNLMELAHSINGIMRIYREKSKQLNIISKNMVVNIWKFLN